MSGWTKRFPPMKKKEVYSVRRNVVLFQLQIITLHTTPRVKYRSLNVRASLRCATKYFKREMEIRTCSL